VVGVLHPDVKSMTPERLRLMREAGCKEVGMSVDSGSDVILAAWRNTTALTTVLS